MLFVNDKQNRHAESIMYGSKQSAGLDIPMPYALRVIPGQKITIDTGIHFRIPEGMYGEIQLRSSISDRGLLSLGGIIDSDYRGAVRVIMLNPTSMSVELEDGERFAQIIIKPCARLSLSQVDQLAALGTTDRGAGGFGSTGAFEKNKSH